MKSLRWAAALGLVGLLGGCGGSPPQTTKPAAAPARPPAPAAVPTLVPKEPEVTPPPAVRYEAKGRRDPFRQPTTTIETKGAGVGGGFTVASVKLVGILQGREGLMALVESPDGLGYILRTGDVLGDGRVVEISHDNVTFSVTERPGQPPARVELKLTSELPGGKR